MPLNTLPFPTSSGVPYYDNKDANNFLTMPVEQYIRNGSNLFVPVSATNPEPTADAAVLAKLVEILAKLTADPTSQTTLEAARALLNTIAGKDFATQTTLAAILNKLIAAPATEAKQTSLEGKVDTIDAVLDSILAKIIAAPATEATLAAILTQLGTTGLKKIIDALPAGNNLIGQVSIDQTTPGATNKVVAELSGSNVDLLGELLNVTVGAGGYSASINVTFINTRYTAYIVGALETNGTGHNFDIQNAKKHSSGKYFQAFTTFISSGGIYNKISDRIPNIADQMSFRVKNNDTSDRTYIVAVYGLKGD